MLEHLPLFPEAASTVARQVDALYFFLVAVSAFFSLLIAVLIVVFAIKYHRRRADQVGAGLTGSLRLEILWSAIPLAITMVMFFWGASLYFRLMRPPADAMVIYVTGKQWMWKAQHADGRREINELHVPVGRPVRLVLGSEDVIHSFYVPAFRVKMDVVPGRTTTLWFEATKPGRYRLFCAEYCGTKHSGMTGWIVALEPRAFQQWLAGGPVEGSLAQQGEKLFMDLGCHTCHLPAGQQGRGPSLEGLFGRPVKLADGSTVTADEAYLREAILQPQARIVAGFQPLMPPYQGLVNEEQLNQLIAYLRALGGPPPEAAPR
ncbi:MAG TPA: cytochrome c oxidase subunit II [Vicinamibacterales bacterium]|nr:cytochrome c oxidase subunit II [Vicinamibacterales bacterium]